MNNEGASYHFPSGWKPQTI